MRANLNRILKCVLHISVYIRVVHSYIVCLTSQAARERERVGSGQMSAAGGLIGPQGETESRSMFLFFFFFKSTLWSLIL